ncbi:hypothetical protein ACFVJQ_28925, partial [Streptomyces sp. NPDC127197]
SAPAQAPAAQSAPDLATSNLSGGMTTRIPLGLSASGSNSLIPTAREAAAAVNGVKPAHGNLWL